MSRGVVTCLAAVGFRRHT